MAKAFDELARSMDELQVALAAIPEERIDEAGVCGEWSVKDLVHHLAYWEEQDAKEIERTLRHEPPPEHGEGDWWQPVNDAVAPTWKSRSYQQARLEMTEARARLVKALDGFAPDDQPDVAEDTWSHYDEHLVQINAWMAAQGLSA